ncbi:MAG: ankyrin repeat-containing domain protein [Podila humilis]|nr:MAG: ankyrin repeat-containing domain protein [Podila humilis]
MAACREDDLDVLEEVLSSDASSFDINHTDGLGNTVLHIAARFGSTQCLEILLYYDGIEVNKVNRLEGDTPLHKAAGYSDPDTALTMVQFLVQKQASPKILNKLKQTAGDVAPSDTHSKVKEYLEQVVLASQFDARDIAVEDYSDSDGEPSDEE